MYPLKGKSPRKRDNAKHLTRNPHNLRKLRKITSLAAPISKAGATLAPSEPFQII
jgi:hypothetical protein